jgi:predicted permease
MERLAAFTSRSVALTGGQEPEQVGAAAVSPDLFPLLGVAAAQGRTFHQEEEVAGSDQVAILSHAIWQRRFGGDPGIVGRTIPLDGNAHTVVGIMPEGFAFPNDQAQMWVPLALTPEFGGTNRGGRFLSVIGRMAPGAGIDQAQAEMSSIAGSIEQEVGPWSRGWGIALVSLHDQAVGGARKPLLVLTAAVGFVLLVACANVANLMLARAVARRREFAVRAALGAGRWHVARLLLAESLFIFLLGGAAGVLLAQWGVELLVASAPPPLGAIGQRVIDGRVLAFTFLLSTLAGALAGLAPGLAAMRTDLERALREGRKGTTEGSSHHAMRAFFVVGQVAISLLLLTGAGLMIRSFGSVVRVAPGFDPEKVITMKVSLPEGRYGAGDSAVGFYERAFEQVRLVPGVRSVAATHLLPLTGSSVRPFLIEGRERPPAGEEPTANYRIVTQDYFRTMGIRLLSGRELSPSDGGAARGIVISDSFARRFLAGEDPLGKRITVGGQPDEWGEIVGVSEDVRHFGLDADVQPEMYWMYSQDWIARRPTLERLRRAMAFVVRMEGDPVAGAPALRRAILAVDRDQPVSDVRTMSDRLSSSVANRRFQMQLMGIFAVVALALSSVGLFGVVSMWVVQRRHEVGVRLALGARRASIFRMVLGSGLAMVMAGVGIGLALSASLTRLLASLLFGVSTTDPVTFAAAPVVLLVVALAASWLPAWRATKVDPMTTLRYE